MPIKLLYTFLFYFVILTAQGNVLAVYEHKHAEGESGTFTLAEQHLYGASRIGMTKPNLALNTTTPATSSPTIHYELTNHLGNVMAVITDEPTATETPAVESLTDYYPFGMTMPDRSYNVDAERYRYGFQRQEREQELWGGESSFFTYRISDNRLGRFFSVDPVSSKFPWNSSYAFSENRLIDGIELEGKEYLSVNNEYISCSQKNGDGSYSITLGEHDFIGIQMVDVGNEKYYNLGKHMYYNNGWLVIGKRSEQVTDATLWGLYIYSEYKLRKESENSFNATKFQVKETWDACSNDEKFFDLGDYSICHAWTMFMINQSYRSIFDKNILDCYIVDSRKNKDLYYSGLIDGNRYGVAKALNKKDKAELFDEGAFWNGVAQLGDPIQKWWPNDNAGHSFIFIRYTYDENGEINGYEAWDKKGDFSDSKSSILENGTEIRGGNLKE